MVLVLLSQILNSLDGFEDKGDTIRFFTANDEKKIFNTSALINRMSSKFEFYYPGINIFEAKLARFLSFYENYDKEKANQFIELLMKRNNLEMINKNTNSITIRPFVNYVIQIGRAHV